MRWLHIEREDHVATVTLDRPPVNAVDNEVLTEIRDAFSSFEDARDIRAVVFTAAGDRAFMGGADLNTVGGRDRSESASPRYVTDPARVAQCHALAGGPRLVARRNRQGYAQNLHHRRRW